MRNASYDGRAAYSRLACRSNMVAVDHLPLHEPHDEADRQFAHADCICHAESLSGQAVRVDDPGKSPRAAPGGKRTVRGRTGYFAVQPLY
jgi:hypothetical protein